MRHAKSSWKTNDPDFLRPLSSRGTRGAVVAGQLLSGYPLDVVLCSAATRAQQTWQAARLGGAKAADVRVLESIYQAWTSRLMDELRALPEDAATVLLIGHEPTLSDLVGSLAAPSALTAAVADRFPTGALAVLTSERRWADLAPGTATLRALEVPRG